MFGVMTLCLNGIDEYTRERLVVRVKRHLDHKDA